jgi:hypothetical protein
MPHGENIMNDDLLDNLEESLRHHGVGSCRKAATICLESFIKIIDKEFGNGAPNYGNYYEDGYNSCIREVLDYLRGNE